MSIILLGKLIVGGSLIAGASTLTLFATGVIGSTIDVYVSVVAADTNKPYATWSTGKYIQCKLNGNDDMFDCKITQIREIDTNKKHINFSNLSFDNSSTLNKLSTEHTLYKLSINPWKYDWSQSKSKDIEIVESGNKETIFSKAKPLFAVNRFGNKLGTTKYFFLEAPVGTAELSSDTSAEGKYACSLNAESNFNECEIFDFDSNNNYSHEQTKTSKIESDKKYLVKFTGQQTDNLNQDWTIFIKKYSEKDDSNKPAVEFKNINPSISIQDKLIILG